MNMELGGKIALVTGAASGLGAAISRELSARGAVVYLADIDFQKAQATARKIGGVPIYLDVSNAAQVETVIREVSKKRGALDIVINNAGIMCPSEELQRFAPEEWRRILSVNLSGTVAVSISAYSVMRHQGFGHISNIGSLGGLIPVPFLGPYTASKAALTGFTLGLAAEAELHGVHVSLVCPGNLATGMARPSSVLPSVSPAVAARRIVKGISHNERIIVFPLYARVMWWMERINPGFIRIWNREIVRRHAKREAEHPVSMPSAA
jgi:NAD(P)-dependent dehydrogenase (short-subunit alcohol dehydrogenase family)